MNGVWFDTIHSFNDLNLILSDVEIPPAEPKTNFVEITGGDGFADLTEALGEVKYGSRVCTFTFTVLPEDDFEEKKREVSKVLNGKRCKIVLDKDPDYYWEGRCALDNYASNKRVHTIVLKATVNPYKLSNSMTRVILRAGQNTVQLVRNGRKTVIPTFTCKASTTVICNGTKYTIQAGTFKLLDIALAEGSNYFTITSTNTVEITYQEGDL